MRLSETAARPRETAAWVQMLLRYGLTAREMPAAEHMFTPPDSPATGQYCRCASALAMPYLSWICSHQLIILPIDDVDIVIG